MSIVGTNEMANPQESSSVPQEAAAANGVTTTQMGRRRYVIAFALLLLAMLSYIDRINISVAAPAILKEFDLSTGQLGLALSAFFWTYTLLLIPFAWLSDRYGTRLIIPIGIVVWSMGAAATGFAGGLVTLLIARLLLGVGESPVFPAGNLVVREWAPAKERGRFTAIFNAGSLIGPAVGAVLAGYLVISFGWRASFIILAVLGFLGAAVWLLVYRTPEQASWISTSERDSILTGREASEDGRGDRSPMSIRALLRMTTTWGLMITQGCAVYTQYLFLSFLPLYLVNQRGLKVFGAGYMTGIIYGIAVLGSVAVAYVSDKVLRSAQVSHGDRRKVVVCTLVLGVVLLAVPYVNSIPAVVVLVAWTLTMITAAITLNFALAGDLTVDKSSAGRVFGLVTLGGNIFGLTAPIVTGYLVEGTKSYAVPFAVAALLLLVGALVSWFMVRRPLQRAFTEARTA